MVPLQCTRYKISIQWSPLRTYLQTFLIGMDIVLSATRAGGSLLRICSSPYMLPKCSVNHSRAGVCHNPPLPVFFLSSEVYICPLQIMYSSNRGIASRIGSDWGGGGKCNWSGGLAIKFPCYHVIELCFYALSASKAKFRARSYSHQT